MWQNMEDNKKDIGPKNGEENDNRKYAIVQFPFHVQTKRKSILIRIIINIKRNDNYEKNLLITITLNINKK